MEKYLGESKSMGDCVVFFPLSLQSKFVGINSLRSDDGETPSKVSAHVDNKCGGTFNRINENTLEPRLRSDRPYLWRIWRKKVHASLNVFLL